KSIICEVPRRPVMAEAASKMRGLPIGLDLENAGYVALEQIAGRLMDFPYIYRWDRHGRKGQFCRVLARGKMNSCCVEFEDGYKMIPSRNALYRRIKAIGRPRGCLARPRMCR